jgi:hypothetical protein
VEFSRCHFSRVVPHSCVAVFGAVEPEDLPLQYSLQRLNKTIHQFDSEWMKAAFVDGGFNDAITDYSEVPLAEVLRQQEEVLAQQRREGIASRTALLKELLGERDGALAASGGWMEALSFPDRPSGSRKETGFDKLMKNLTLMGIPVTRQASQMGSLESDGSEAGSHSPVNVMVPQTRRVSKVQGMSGADFILKYSLTEEGDDEGAMKAEKPVTESDAVLAEPSVDSIHTEATAVQQHMRVSVWGRRASNAVPQRTGYDEAAAVVETDAGAETSFGGAVVEDDDLRMFFGEVWRCCWF